MGLVLGALGDPPFEQFLLLGRERLVGFRRRHDLLGVVFEHPGHQLAIVRLAGDDGPCRDGQSDD